MLLSSTTAEEAVGVYSTDIFPVRDDHFCPHTLSITFFPMFVQSYVFGFKVFVSLTL